MVFALAKLLEIGENVLNINYKNEIRGKNQKTEWKKQEKMENKTALDIAKC